jgi:hypothetical protein
MDGRHVDQLEDWGMFVGGVEWLRLKMKPNNEFYFILHET